MNDQKTDRDWATRILDLATECTLRSSRSGCSKANALYAESIDAIEDILDERDAAIIRGFREKGLLNRHDN